MMQKLYLGLTEEEEEQLNAFINHAERPLTVSMIYDFMKQEQERNGLFQSCVVTAQMQKLLVQRMVGW